MGILRRREPDQQSETTSDPDGLLVAWAQQNPQAFAALYDRYFPGVYGYCLSQLRDTETAEDATSQTFLKALSALPGYRETGRFRSWLFSIAHNTVIDEIGGYRSEAPLESASGLVDAAAIPEAAASTAFDLAWLDRAIARLPVADQQVLELRRAGLTGREIASVLGISHEAAKKRQLRAMDRVRTELIATPGNQEALHGA